MVVDRMLDAGAPGRFRAHDDSQTTRDDAIVHDGSGLPYSVAVNVRTFNNSNSHFYLFSECLGHNQPIAPPTTTPPPP
jgi:hypothetical protein